MTATISTTQQAIDITEVGSIVVSDVVPDPDFGGYVRLIQVMGVPVNNTSNAPLLLQLRVRSGVSANIDITAPPQQF